jgi:6-pyruvoyltetrahydropterin/6-carboxytetrahydropterin synthase
LDVDENARLYGKCNNPYGHGHDYILEVTVAGEVDAVSGLIIRVSQLDRFVQDKILRLFAHRNINLDVAQFAELVPTTENLATVIAGMIQADWPTAWTAKPVRVHIQETARNGFEVLFNRHPKESVTTYV